MFGAECRRFGRIRRQSWAEQCCYRRSNIGPPSPRPGVAVQGADRGAGRRARQGVDSPAALVLLNLLQEGHRPDVWPSACWRSTAQGGPALPRDDRLGLDPGDAVQKALADNFAGHGLPGGKLGLALGKGFKPTGGDLGVILGSIHARKICCRGRQFQPDEGATLPGGRHFTPRDRICYTCGPPHQHFHLWSCAPERWGTALKSLLDLRCPLNWLRRPRPVTITVRSSHGGSMLNRSKSLCRGTRCNRCATWCTSFPANPKSRLPK
jgi:hypothetical protein